MTSKRQPKPRLKTKQPAKKPPNPNCPTCNHVRRLINTALSIYYDHHMEKHK